MPGFQDILYMVEGPLGVITLNRPAYRNAQSYRMLDEIDQAFALAKVDGNVRVVIVRGAGGVFSARAVKVGRSAPSRTDVKILARLIEPPESCQGSHRRRRCR